MKPLLFPLVALLVLVQANRSPVTAQGKPAPDWSVEPPKVVNLPIGGTGYLNVEIQRKGLNGPVSLVLEGLPAGITARQKEITLADGESRATFVLTGAANLKEGTVTGPRVVATADVSKVKEFTIEVKDFNLQSSSALVMALSVLAVLALTGFCIWRVFTLPPVEVEEHLKGPLEIDTRDTQDAD